MMTATIILITALYLTFVLVSNTITAMINRSRRQEYALITILAIITAILWGVFYYFNSTK